MRSPTANGGGVNSTVEQMTTMKEFIIHRLVFDLNNLDRVNKHLRSKNSLPFLR